MTVATQFSLRQVQVLALIPERNTAQVRTYVGTSQMPPTATFEVPVVPMRVRLPAPGEVWVLDKTLGYWTFAALMKAPDIYQGGRGTGWLQVPATWIPKPSNAASLAASISRYEDRVTLRVSIGALGTGSVVSATGTIPPGGWQPTENGLTLPITGPAGVSSVLVLNDASTGFWKLSTLVPAAPAAVTELTWLTGDTWPDTSSLTVSG